MINEKNHKYSATVFHVPEICWDGLYSDQYTGHVAVTSSGLTCQAWASQTPHVHDINNQDSDFPDDTVAAASNYCRDPDGEGVPWCYTTDGGTRWEHCDVLCPGILVTYIL